MADGKAGGPLGKTNRRQLPDSGVRNGRDKITVVGALGVGWGRGPERKNLLDG